MEDDFYARMIGEGVIAVSGAAVLGGASGLVDSVVYNGVGDVTVVLRAPGLRVGGQQSPAPPTIPSVYIQPITTPAMTSYTFPDATHIRVTTFDHTGAPVDAPFNILIRTTQRRLV